MDRRIAAGVGLFLALEAVNTYQLVLPPLYSDSQVDSNDVRKATRFVGIYILILAFLTGVLTQSVYPILLPAIALAVIHFVWLMESGNRIATTIPTDEEGED